MVRDPRFHQGLYKLRNNKKYLGNPDILFYKSGLERRFFTLCDLSENILQWSYEQITIPYYFPIDKKVHRYILDGWIEIKEGGKINKYIVEVKNYSKLIKPVLNEAKINDVRSIKRYNAEMYDFIKNQCKWKFAKEYAIKHKMEFKIITEKELKLIK